MVVVPRVPYPLRPMKIQGQAPKTTARTTVCSIALLSLWASPGLAAMVRTPRVQDDADPASTGASVGPEGPDGDWGSQEPSRVGEVPEPRAIFELEASGPPLELSLERALEMAVAADLGLQIEEQNTLVSRFDYAGSWGAFDPLLSASASFSDAEFEGQTTLAGAQVLEVENLNWSTGLNLPLTTGGNVDVNFSSGRSETNNSFQLVNPSTTDNVSITYTQPLMRGAWNEFATSQQRESKLGYQAQIETYRQKRQELMLSVIEAYYDVVAAEEQLSIAEETLELGNQQLEQNDLRLRAGAGTEVEVLQASANVAQRVEQRLQAEMNLRAAHDSLKSMLFPGTNIEAWSTSLVLVTPLPSHLSSADNVPDWEQALYVALEHRPELHQQRLRIDQAEVQLSRSRSNRRSQLDLVLTASSRGFDGSSGEAFGEALGFEFPTASAALNYTMPLGNRTAKNAERVSRVNLRRSRLQYTQLETQVVSEVRNAVRQVLYQSQAVEAAGVSLDFARRQLEAEQTLEREGLSTTFQVLEFEEDYTTALSNERAARANYAKSLAQLQKAQGVLGEAIP